MSLSLGLSVSYEELDGLLGDATSFMSEQDVPCVRTGSTMENLSALANFMETFTGCCRDRVPLFSIVLCLSQSERNYERARAT